MAKVRLGKRAFDLPDSCEETIKALKQADSALSDYAKSGDSRKYRETLEYIIKTAIPNDLKNNNKALHEVSKTVKEHQEAIDSRHGRRE